MIRPSPQGAISEIHNLKDLLFDSDFSDTGQVISGLTLVLVTEEGNKSVKFGVKLYLDLQARSKFLGYFIPKSPEAFRVCAILASESLSVIEDLESKNTIATIHGSDFSTTSQKDLVFTNTVYIYHESLFTDEQLAELEKLYESQGLAVVFRGPAYFSIERSRDR